MCIITMAIQGRAMIMVAMNNVPPKKKSSDDLFLLGGFPMTLRGIFFDFV